ESLTLLLTRPTVEKHMAGLKVVIVDEWHELLGSKRGVQTELASPVCAVEFLGLWSGDSQPPSATLMRP
ncbi:MAG: hypothetical protein KJO28_02325, partial [Desulfofustis sp.]|nr:hypothetical protein [Desulfofustis sp.]